ncbi:nuclease [Paraphotobacterium marinum]|uniref:Nuclease n=1 Tax=Paraphotobacterium marinum TaxID=1755811 RepID=A0A220VEE9_9GAMM|nr:NYN domain-containing protein [Paraphotobacterium marinum]ASK78670.1 nuclease [Paraphotobacterium marinum]
MVQDKENVSIFVDVQNIYYTCQEAFKRNFDYNAFWSEISQSYNIIDAYAYAIQRNEIKQIQFQNILKAIGFQIKLKPFIKRKDGTAKGDWDVGITIDMLDAAETSDRLILLSGDGDFTILLDTIKTKFRKRVDVYGVNSLTSNSLINSANLFRTIDDTLLLR